jgi:BirA family biotin operon repressor/biotin-[acetyl-CoA-carboxylase] ligase
MPRLIERARTLRKNLTDAEKHLWKHLRMNQLDNLRFRRQAPIDQYVVDFVCFEKRLIIEADGGQHNDSESDRIRDAYLKEQGFRVMRFRNHDILSNVQGVLEMIRASCQDPPSTPPLTSILPREGGGS